MPAGPASLLNAVAPSRAALVVCVACLFPWDWLAALGARDGIPFVLGHALSLQARHGGKAKTDHMDAQHMAVLLRGGRRPQAYVSPAALRATRDLRRRRSPLRRHRAALVTPVQHTQSPYHWPTIGHNIASKANRTGGAERCAAPAGHTSVAVDRAPLDSEDALRRALAWAMVTTAQQHDATTLDLLQPVPGSGQILRLVRWDAIHDLARFPRGQDCVASGRLVTWAQAAAGKR